MRAAANRLRLGMAPNENPAGATAGLKPNHGRIKKGTHMVVAAIDRSKRLSPVPVAEPPPVPQIRTVQDLEHYIAVGRRGRFYAEALVTPEMARFVLDRNDANRRLSEGLVERYADDMRRGEWRLNGQGIIISSTGELNDGQHRLSAVIAADIPAPMGITFGVERESRATVDVGRKRTLGDHLAMNGEKNAVALAATLRFAWCYDNEFNLNSSPSVEQMFDYLGRHGSIRQAVTDVGMLVKSFRLHVGPVAGAYFICSRFAPQVALDLLNGSVSGLNLTETGSPIYKLRQRYQDHLAGGKPLEPHEDGAVFIIAFNAKRHKKNLRALRWTAYGVEAKPFPIAGI